MKLDPYFTPTKINIRWVKDKHKTWNEIKLLEENLGGKLSNTGLGNDFLDMSLKAQKTKAKNRQMGAHQNRKLLCCKQSTEWKVTYGLRENICKPHIWKGNDIQNIRRTPTCQ